MTRHVSKEKSVLNKRAETCLTRIATEILNGTRVYFDRPLTEDKFAGMVLRGRKRIARRAFRKAYAKFSKREV